MVYYQLVPKDVLKKYHVRYEYDSKSSGSKTSFLELDARDSQHAQEQFSNLLQSKKWRKAKNIDIKQASWRY